MQRLADFFCKGPNSKYCRLFRPYGLCYNYSTCHYNIKVAMEIAKLDSVLVSLCLNMLCSWFLFFAQFYLFIITLTYFHGVYYSSIFKLFLLIGSVTSANGYVLVSLHFPTICKSCFVFLFTLPSYTLSQSHHNSMSLPPLLLSTHCDLKSSPLLHRNALGEVTVIYHFFRDWLFSTWITFFLCLDAALPLF